ncbi:MAG: pitrilysin family protein [Candidatus Aminicenantales bacterium]
MKKIWVVMGIFVILSGIPLYPQQEHFRRFPPPPDPLQELKLPPIASALLSNGLGVSVVSRENVPFMSVQLVVFAGEVFSSGKLPGTATFAAGMFGRGTLIHSASDIDEIMESIGGTLSVAVNQDYVLVTFNFLEEHLDQALDLLSQMILQPNFAENEIASIKRRTAYDLIDKERDPQFVGKRTLLRLLFKDHPYAKQAFSSEVVKNWNQADLMDFFDRYYRPNNAHIILTGNISLGAATRKVSHYLSTWRPQDIPPVFPLIPKPPDKDKICLIDVPQAKNCAIYIGAAFPTPTVQERFDLTVLNQILGGTFASRLFMNLRESKQYAKFAFSEINFLKDGGVFFAQALDVNPQTLIPAVQEIQREIKALTGEPISFQEIEQAKSFLMHHFPLEIERFNDMGARAAEIKARDGGDEGWNKYYEQVKLVDAGRVFDAAQKFLLQPFYIVIAGDKNVLFKSFIDFDTYDVYDNKGQFQYSVTKDKKGALNEAR